MLSLLIALLVSAGPQAAPPPPAGQAPAPRAPSALSQSYLIGANDVLNIRVFDEPTLTGLYQVDADGGITYPYIGRLDVAKKTARQVADLITKRLADGYLRNPQVTVEIGEFRSRGIFVMGEVRSPGKYAIEGDVTLLEVLAKAGSLTTTAGNEVVVLRPRDQSAAAPATPDQSAEVLRVNLDELRSGQLTANIPLQDGDTILVPPAPRFYVSGFVRNPGAYVLTSGMTVQQAITLAGGITDRGSQRGIKIKRTVNGKDVELDAKLSDKVLPNDTIVIRQRFI